MALADLLLCAKCDHPAHSHVHGRCSGEDGRPCPCGRFRSPSADKRELEQAGTTRVELAELAGKLERLAWIVENGGVLRTRWTRDVLREAASALRASAVADALRRHGVTADEVRGILRPAPDSPTEQGGAEARGDLGRGHHPDCRFESFNACRERWEAQGRDVGHLKPMDPRAGFVHCAPGCPHRERDEEHAKTLRSDPRPPSDSPEARVQSGVGSTPESARPCGPAPANPTPREGGSRVAELEACCMEQQVRIDALTRQVERLDEEPAPPDQGSEQEQARVLRAEIAAVADRLRVALTHPTSDHGLARAVQGQLDTLNELASHPSTEPEQPTRADRGEG